MHKYISPSGNIVVIGKNSKENIQVTLSGKQEDLWFHVKDSPGAHGLLIGGAGCASEDIIFAAVQTAHHSIGSGQHKSVHHKKVRRGDKVVGVEYISALCVEPCDKYHKRGSVSITGTPSVVYVTC